MTIILGIDPGLHKTGWGIIEKQGNSLRYIAGDTIYTDEKATLAERLSKIYNELTHAISLYKPNEAAVEETFINKNALSSLKLGHARGVILLAISLAGIMPKEYAATLVKKSIVGVGRAEKHQVQMMIKTILPGANVEKTDTADALAVAVCHANHSSKAYLL